MGTLAYWRSVSRRAARESLDAVGWSNPARMLIAVAVAIVALGTATYGGVYGFAVTSGAVVVLAVWKLAQVPAAMHDEAVKRAEEAERRATESKLRIVATIGVARITDEPAAVITVPLRNVGPRTVHNVQVRLLRLQAIGFTEKPVNRRLVTDDGHEPSTSINPGVTVHYRLCRVHYGKRRLYIGPFAREDEHQIIFADQTIFYVEVTSQDSASVEQWLSLIWSDEGLSLDLYDSSLGASSPLPLV